MTNISPLRLRPPIVTAGADMAQLNCQRSRQIRKYEFLTQILSLFTGRPSEGAAR